MQNANQGSFDSSSTLLRPLARAIKILKEKNEILDIKFIYNL